MTTPPSTPSRVATLWLITSSALAIAGALLIWMEPPRALRALGSLLGWSGAIGLAYGVLCGLSSSRPRPDSTQTVGEKIALLSFVSTASIGSYMFFTLQALGWALDPESDLLTDVVIVLIVVMLAESILADILRRREAVAVVDDERDAYVRSRAAGYAHTLLFVLLIGFVIHLGVGAPRTRVTTPVAIAHALIFIMIASEMTRHAAEILLYWRDRR